MVNHYEILLSEKWEGNTSVYLMKSPECWSSLPVGLKEPECMDCTLFYLSFLRNIGKVVKKGKFQAEEACLITVHLVVKVFLTLYILICLYYIKITYVP